MKVLRAVVRALMDARAALCGGDPPATWGKRGANGCGGLNGVLPFATSSPHHLLGRSSSGSRLSTSSFVDQARAGGTMLDRVRLRIDSWHARLARRGPFWTALREVGNSPASQAVILVPLIGYWIIFNEYIAGHYANLTGELMPRAQNGPPMRLYWTYLGLCSVAAASALYRLCCPSEVKRYPDAAEYIGSVLSHISSAELGRIQKVLQRSDLATQLTAANRQKIANPSSEQNDAWKLEILDLYFDDRDRSSPIVRMIAAGCYAVGLIILVWLSLEVFWRVVQVMFRAMLAG